MEIPLDKIDEYLFFTKEKKFTPSETYFKMAVYSLRFAYRMYGLKDRYIQLPSIKKEKRLPVVLSKEEVIKLLAVPESLKHRVLLNLLYGCGLRCFEVRNIKHSDLDFDRRMLHVRAGKGRKDRYVPISEILVSILKEYMGSKKSTTWLFDGQNRSLSDAVNEVRYAARTAQWVVKQAAKKAGITKDVTMHTLRHTFATHLLEDGLDIVSIKELLGHERIATTMVYLHVGQYSTGKAFSPLDTLYGLKKPIVKTHLCPFFPSKFDGVLMPSKLEVMELN
ncbi:MAG: integrase [Flavobacterium sp.]|nr:MAG: integrase [Flavobacterium sp.]